VAEDQVCAVVRSLRRRRGGAYQLLVHRSGPCWHDGTATDINDYLREVAGGDHTAKDIRTWHATIIWHLLSDPRPVSSTSAQVLRQPGQQQRQAA
jgi:hypothetical protein